MKTTTFAAALVIASFVCPVTAAEQLTYDVRFNDSFITASEDAISDGDRILINDHLLEDGVEVGRAVGVCTIIDPASGSSICNISFQLVDGEIAVQFINSPPPEKTFAVTGGTGAYAGSTGSGTLIENGDETGIVTFQLK